MIKFFRKIRQNLITEDKTVKYLKYAIGEIVLVVIGILIALGINNWNQGRLEQNEKEVIFSKIHEEFKANKEAQIGYLKYNNRAINAGIKLMNLIGSSREELAEHNLDSLISELMGVSDFVFPNTEVNNIVQSGRLDPLEDEIISTLLYQWNGLLLRHNDRQNKITKWTYEQTLPFLLQHISLKEMDIQTNFPWTGKSKVKPDYYPLFQKVEFENLLDNTLWGNQKSSELLKEAESLIDQILEATKLEQ